MTPANIQNSPVFSARGCVKCPEKPPKCTKCPDGKVCVLTAQSCESCPGVKCINDPAKTRLSKEQTSGAEKSGSKGMKGNDTETSGHKTKVGVIIGVCTAALVFVLVCLVVFLWYRKYRQKQNQEDSDEAPTSIKGSNNSNTNLPPLSFEPRNSHAPHKLAPISQVSPFPLSRPPYGEVPPPPMPPHHRPYHHHQSERKNSSQLVMQRQQRTSFYTDDPRNTYTSLKPIQPPSTVKQSSVESKGPRTSSSSFKRKRSKPVISAPLPPSKEVQSSRPLSRTPPTAAAEEDEQTKMPVKGNGRFLERLNNKPLSTISNRISSHFLHATRSRTKSTTGEVVGKSYSEVESVHGNTDNERDEQESIDLRYSFVPQSPPQLPDVGWTGSINSLTWSQVEKRQSLGFGNKSSRQSSQSQMIPQSNQQMSIVRRDKPRLFDNGSNSPQPQQSNSKTNSIIAPRRLNSFSEPFIMQPSTANHKEEDPRPTVSDQRETLQASIPSQEETLLPNISNQGEPILNKQSTPKFTDIVLDSYIPIAYFPETAETVGREAEGIGESDVPEQTTESNYSHNNEITEESELVKEQPIQKTQVYNLFSAETIKNLEDLAPSVYSPEPTMSTEPEMASLIEQSRCLMQQTEHRNEEQGRPESIENVYNDSEGNDSTENLIPELLSRIKQLRETSLTSVSQSPLQSEAAERLTPTTLTTPPSSLSSPYRNKFAADLADQRHLSVPPPPLARPGYSVVRPLTFTGSYRLEEEIAEDRHMPEENGRTTQAAATRKQQPETIREMGALETDQDVSKPKTEQPSRENDDHNRLSQNVDFEYPVIFDDNDISFITFRR